MSELRRIVGILIAGAIVAAGFVVVIHLGYVINEGRSPPGLTEAFPAAVVVLLVGAGLLVRWIWLNPPMRGIRHRPLPSRPDQRAAAQQARADQAAYAADPMRLATCEHLRPIERAMRADGVPMSLYYGPVVRAECTVDEARLVTRFSIEPPLSFHAHVPGDRPGDPGGAMIHCRDHSSLIEVVPAVVARPDTRVWPAAVEP